MPMIATTGRSRIGAFSAASVVVCSSAAIGGCVVAVGAGGKVKIQPPKPTTNSISKPGTPQRIADFNMTASSSGTERPADRASLICRERTLGRPTYGRNDKSMIISANA
jgi:hypothetical protein